MPFSKSTLSPGDFVQAVCTRCREVLRHTVVAMVEGRPARVKCNTCDGEHDYRPATEITPGPAQESAPGKKAARAPRRASARPRSNAATLEAEWAAQLAAADTRDRRRYAATAVFRAGEILDHPSFGAGVVQKILEPGKILVLFSSGTKTLVCGKS